MRVRLTFGSLLLVLGGGVLNSVDPAWVGQGLIGAGVVFCGLVKGRERSLVRARTECPQRSVLVGQLK